METPKPEGSTVSLEFLERQAKELLKEAERWKNVEQSLRDLEVQCLQKLETLRRDTDASHHKETLRRARWARENREYAEQQIADCLERLQRIRNRQSDIAPRWSGAKTQEE